MATASIKDNKIYSEDLVVGGVKYLNINEYSEETTQEGGETLKSPITTYTVKITFTLDSTGSVAESIVRRINEIVIKL
jgi:hypothetical protein